MRSIYISCLLILCVAMWFPQQADARKLIRCHGKDSCKDYTKRCRTGEKCRIECFGESACSGNTVLDGSKATVVKFLCTGKDSCKGNTVMKCGTGKCVLKCAQPTSCEDATIYCGAASSFVCKGGYCGSSNINFVGCPNPYS
eukprot:UN02667